MKNKTKPVRYHAFSMPSPGGLVAFVLVLFFLYLFFSDQDFFGKDRTSIVYNYTGYRDQHPEVVNVLRVLSVQDGDTLTVVPVELNVTNDKGVRVRLRGINAPELEGACDDEMSVAQASRDWLIQIVSSAQSMQLLNVEYDDEANNSIVADVLLDGFNLSTLSIAAGHSVRWQTKNIAYWCE